MRKTTPGIDRLIMQELRASKTKLTRAITGHMNHCHQCHQAGNDVYAHCSDWWDLAVALHKLRRKLRHLETPELDGQDTLPGMP